MIVKFGLLLLAITTLVWANPIEDNDPFEYTRNIIRTIGLERATTKIVERYGYPIEEHFTQTADGYILKLHRIPRGLETPVVQGRPVVFLQHGLLCSSADWIVQGPERGLGFILADRGYDVWMGNYRGNTHSRSHVYLSPNTKAFWDFSWDEMGHYDLPAMIDYVLGHTGQSNLHYVGHSQGTTSFFIMGSMRPEYNAKIRSMHALAPVAFMSNLKSPFVRALSPFVDQVEWIMKMLGVYEFLPSNDMMINGGQLICKDTSLFQEVCANVLFLIGGFNSPQLNRTLIPALLEATPAGASVNQLVHYGQGVNSGKFRKYDYGLLENLSRYGSINPPEYPLSRVTAPVFLHYSDNDWLAANRDVDELAGKLGNLVGKFRVPDDKFNHLDYTYATDVKSLLYDRVISLMERM